MPSSISNSRNNSVGRSRYLPVVSFLATFFLLMLGWELIIRAHYKPASAHIIERPSSSAVAVDETREWLAFGNCLILNAISPAVFHDVWQQKRPGARVPKFRNLAKHEYAPQAYLSYLRGRDYYPQVLVFNVSSWLNSDNFHAEAVKLEEEDLLGLRAERGASSEKFVVGTAKRDHETFQSEVESALREQNSKLLRMSEKNYHLFDFGMFLRALGRSADLERSLYELQIQSWYELKAIHRDGHGQKAFEVDYSKGWERALAIMSEKQLSRMRLGNFLTPTFWASLEAEIQEFRKHGTQIVLLRMPEHVDIYEFNEGTYDLSQKMQELAHRTGSAMLDLNRQKEIISLIRLYDGVHPDQRSSTVISSYVADWMMEQYPEWVYSATPAP